MTIRTPLALALATLLLAGCDAAPDATADTAAPPADTATADATADPDLALRDDMTNPLDAILAGDWRDAKNTPRDAWRHPRETLDFFGVGADQRIIEISPGGGWYTEILAPLPKEKGGYVGVLMDPAAFDDAGARDYYAKNNQKLRDKLAARPDIYGTASLIEIDPAAPVLGVPESADVVLTFRNVHNWVMDGNEAAMFKAFFDVLRPGGILGVTDHRAAAGRTLDEVKESGYLPEDYVIGLATAAGFVLEEKSEINANPADPANWEGGVWTLPPGYRGAPEGSARRAELDKVGESDRMTLLFRKRK